jgi:hypothetical protein
MNIGLISTRSISSAHLAGIKIRTKHSAVSLRYEEENQQPLKPHYQTRKSIVAYFLGIKPHLIDAE